jgi:hypothetical protein
MDTMRTIERKLRHLEQFSGANLRSDVLSIDGELHYVVYSYRTLIAMYGPIGSGAVIDTKYSPTTTRHQNLIRRAWGLA